MTQDRRVWRATIDERLTSATGHKRRKLSQINVWSPWNFTPLCLTSQFTLY